MTRSRYKQIILIVILAVCLAVPAFAQTPSGKGSKGKRAPVRSRGGLIEMNFRNVEIGNFLTLMSQAFGIAFVWDEKVIRGEITLVSPRKFKRKDALQIFETVIAMQGYTTVRSPGSPVVLVVPLKDASRLPGPTRSQESRDGSSQFVTQIISLRFANANQIRTVLQPIISKSASLVVYAAANVLVISDNQDNISRILKIVKTLDVEPGDVEFVVVRLKYASASKLAPILTSLAGKAVAGRTAGSRAGRKRAGSGTIKIVADGRTNSLLLVAGSVAIAQYRRLIEALDVPGMVSDSGVKVYRLQHADAMELVKILETVKESAGTAVKGQPGKGRTFVTADKATNSLIVFGPPVLIATMDQMVKELDIRRQQVFVEALIMEMTLEKSLQLGVRWQATGTAGSAAVGGGFPNAAPQTQESALAAGSGAVIGVMGNTIEFAGQSFSSFSGFIQATRQDQDLNILANPQILTLNNEEAVINVSQVVPVSARVITNSNLQTTTEFEFKDVGIILSIRPQITGNNKVRLIIKQESSSVAARQVGISSNQQAITTLKRSISTQVLVDDNATVVIGGLIQDQLVETETKVPCLGDIPVIGWLFKTRTEELRKINLIVFIRPRIIRSEDDLRNLSESAQIRYDRARDIRVDTDELLRESFNLRPAPSDRDPEADETDVDGTDTDTDTTEM